MSNPRIAQLEDQIQETISLALDRRVKDPRLGYVTITDVRLTGDAQQATVFYTTMDRSLDGREADAVDGKSDTAAALESAKGMLRTIVGEQLRLKNTPTLTFVQDASEETAKQMSDLLDRVRASDEALAAQREGASYAGEPDAYRKPADGAQQ